MVVVSREDWQLLFYSPHDIGVSPPYFGIWQSGKIYFEAVYYNFVVEA